MIVCHVCGKVALSKCPLHRKGKDECLRKMPVESGKHNQTEEEDRQKASFRQASIWKDAHRSLIVDIVQRNQCAISQVIDVRV